MTFRRSRIGRCSPSRRVAYCAVLVSAAIACAAPGSAGTTGLAGGQLFWTESPTGADDGLGSILSADANGTKPSRRVVGGARTPAGVALAGDYVYWANFSTGTISRARADGSQIKQAFIRTGRPHSVIGVVVDSAYIYWTERSDFDAGPSIGRARLDGSAVDLSFIPAGGEPTGIDVDGAHVYWTHRDTHVTRSGVYFTYAIGRANRDGTGIDQQFVRAANTLTGVAVTSGYIFWASSGDHAIGRADIDGSHVWQRCIDTHASPLETVPEGIAADESHVYWTAYPADAIGRADLSGRQVDPRFRRTSGVPGGIAVAGGTRLRAPGSASMACRGSSAPLILGPRTVAQGPYGAGWGEVAPAVISNGGAASSGSIFQIHWSSWGGTVAVGKGLHPAYAPNGGYYPDPLPMDLRASRPRRCSPGGRILYTRLAVRQPVRPGGKMGSWFAWSPDLCKAIH